MNASRLLLAVILSTGTCVWAQQSPYPDGYWDRQYGYGQQWSTMYSLSLKVDSISKAHDAAEKILQSAGGTTAGGGYGYAGRPGNMGYLLPAETAEKTAKRLMTLGDLQQYNRQKLGGESTLPEVKDKIGEIEKEMHKHADALAEMPAAAALLTSTLSRLRQARDSIESSSGKAMISLSLADAATPEGQIPRYGGIKRAYPVIPAESAAKGNLGAIRSALSIYYGDNEGKYPDSLSRLTEHGKYLSSIPKIKLADHAETDAVLLVSGVKDMAGLRGKLKDKGGYAYVSDPGSPLNGTVVIDCTHTDSRGTVWYQY